MRIRGILLVAMLASCGGRDGVSSLVRVSDEPPGANCANGGVAIESGSDDNGNGVLDADEVDSTQYVCNGASETATLVATADEPPGVNCAAGGTVVRFGADQNGNGLLDAGEVTQTVYVCNGAGGESVLVATADAGSHCASGGTAVYTGVDDNGDGVLQAGEIDTTTYVCDGADALVVTEDAGAACPAGGTIVHTGIDDNGDGTLEPSEYDDSTTICNGTGGASHGPVLDGSYTIHNSFDADALAGVTHITGLLVIEAPGMQHLSLPDLAQVDGGINTVDCSGLEDLSMPALTTTEAVSLNGCHALTSMDFSALTSVRFLQLVDLPQIASFATFASVSSMGGLNLELDPLITSLAPFAGITALNDSFQITQLDALTQIDMPALASAGQIYITNNASLAWLTLPALTADAGPLVVSGDPLLPTCHATDIRDQLLAHGWTGTAIITGTVACVSVDFCRLQFPLDTTAHANDTLTYYGRWFSSGLTTQSTGIDASPLVRAAAGIGPDGTAPTTSSWTWTSAVPNPAWDGNAAGEPNNDEWQASVSAPAIGTYDTAFRWSGDNGRTWTYCDRDAGAGSDGSQDGYQIANAGSLVVN